MTKCDVPVWKMCQEAAKEPPGIFAPIDVIRNLRANRLCLRKGWLVVVWMRLYLVQHAESKRKEEDPLRPLSEKGWEDIRKVAKHAEKHLQIQVKHIVHSGKLRAKQTAEVLAEHLHPAEGVTVAEDLEPLADPKVWENQLAGTTENIVIVGHLPHLSKLATLLLTGDESEEVVEFRMGKILCLERDESARWKVQWMIMPEIIP